MADNDCTIPLKTCRTCGHEFPATSEFFNKNVTYKDGLASDCKVCKRAYQKEYTKNNPEKVAANKKKWQQNNKDKQYAATRRWMANNPDHVDAYYSKYYQEHKSEYRERNKKWYAANPEKAREFDKKWRRNNPEKVHAKWARRRDAPGSHTSDDIKLQYKSQRGKCWWCSKEVGDNYHVDHLIPISRGGTHNPENLVISCPHCNTSRADRLPHEWSDRLL